MSHGSIPDLRLVDIYLSRRHTNSSDRQNAVPIAFRPLSWKTFNRRTDAALFSPEVAPFM